MTKWHRFSSIFWLPPLTERKPSKMDCGSLIKNAIFLYKQLVPDNGEKTKFEDLPEECVREILFRLADHRDLLSAAEACGLAQKLSAEQRLWKRLCRFHFTPVQISFVLREIQKEREKPPLNTSNKNNRNTRTPHPYFNNILRRSPVRTHDAGPSNPDEVTILLIERYNYVLNYN